MKPSLLPLVILTCVCPLQGAEIAWVPVDSRSGDAILLTPTEMAAHTAASSGSGAPRNVRTHEDAAVAGFTIDRSDRNSVVAAYHRYYVTSEDYTTSHQWDGNVKLCEARTVSQKFHEETLRRINWFRAQAGQPADIHFTAEKNAGSQLAALMMSRNKALDHTPPADWLCHSSGGAEAAGNGNLSLGNHGPGAVNAQIRDDGDNNAAAGHRRWLLFSRAQEMGNGAIPVADQDFPAAACIWVVGNFKPPGTAQATPWPNAGFVPWDVVPNDALDFPRWSFSFPGADFSNARVTMNRSGVPVALTIEPLSSGAGDNTIVWRPRGVPAAAPASDSTYSITVADVRNAPQAAFQYDVTVIDPYQLESEAVITGPANPPVDASADYQFAPVSGADRYEVAVAVAQPGTWREEAEAPSATVADGTSADYNLLTMALAATGTAAFHLTLPDRNLPNQSFTIMRDIVPSTGSRLEFQNRFRFVSEATRLIAEVSTDGARWEELWARPGDAASSSGSSATWESTWNPVSVAFPPRYHGRAVQLRFRLARPEAGGRYYLGTTPSTGAFIDDIRVTGSEELTGSVVTGLPRSSTGFRFSPDEERTYVLRVRAELGMHWFSYGPAFRAKGTKGAGLVPVLSAASTASGAAGDRIELAGNHFSSTPAENIVTFGDRRAEVTAATATSLTVVLPGGILGEAPLSVTVGGRTSNVLDFTITGVPMITAEPASADFGDVPAGSARLSTFRLRNPGSAELLVDRITSGHVAFTVNANLPVAIAPGSNRDFSVTFAPASPGIYSGTVQIFSNAGNTPVLTVSLSGAAFASEVVYQTDFSQFERGLETIAGVDGWDSISTGDGSHGTITPTNHPRLGQSAFIGFNPPDGDFSGIFRRMERDPLAEGMPLVDFTADLIIMDSANAHYDIFSLRIHNSANGLLGTVTLDNRTLQMHTWNGEAFRNTGKTFENNVLFTLSGTIDFESNTWSANVNSTSPASMHLPLFENIAFHEGQHPLDLGVILFAWNLGTSENPGDNWMLIDNLKVSLRSKRPAPAGDLVLSSAWRDAGGTFRMTWPASPGVRYRVEYSADLVNWHADLPGSTFITSGQSHHTFPDASSVGNRFYRVVVIP